MRIAGTSYTDSLVSQLNVLTAQQYQLQSQVSTGQRVQAPEDDPAAMARALALRTQAANARQYAQNVSTVQTTATAVSDTLQQLKSISDRAGEIATLADGTKTPADLKSYAQEVSSMIQHALQLANTKSGDYYLFAGTKTTSTPFAATVDASGNITAVSYNGDTNVAQREIGQDSTVTVDVPGANTTGSGPRGLLTDSRYGTDFFNHLIALQQNLASGDTNTISSTTAPALAKDEDNLIYHITNIGLTQSRLEAAAADASSGEASAQTSLTKVAGVDVTKAITDLSQVQNVYQAALASSSVLLKLQQSVMQYL